MSSIQLSELEYDVSENSPRSKLDLTGAIPFFLIHVAAIVGAFFVEWTTEAIAIGLISYVMRMFGVTAGYHRYFSHRTFKMSRFGQFLMAFLAQSSAQRGALRRVRSAFFAFFLSCARGRRGQNVTIFFYCTNR